MPSEFKSAAIVRESVSYSLIPPDRRESQEAYDEMEKLFMPTFCDIMRTSIDDVPEQPAPSSG